MAVKAPPVAKATATLLAGGIPGQNVFTCLDSVWVIVALAPQAITILRLRNIWVPGEGWGTSCRTEKKDDPPPSSFRAFPPKCNLPMLEGPRWSKMQLTTHLARSRLSCSCSAAGGSSSTGQLLPLKPCRTPHPQPTWPWLTQFDLRRWGRCVFPAAVSKMWLPEIRDALSPSPFHLSFHRAFGGYHHGSP